VVHNRDHPVNLQKHLDIMHAKNYPGRQGLTQKASHTFFFNTSVQQNIAKSIHK